MLGQDLRFPLEPGEAIRINREGVGQKRNVYWSFVANLESCLLKS